MNTNKASKGTPIDKYQRKNLILEKLAEGKSRLEIQKELKSKYDVSDSTINSDFLSALSELQKQQDSFNSNIKQVIADRYELLWKKAIDKNDLKSALTLLKQQSDLFGLNVQKQEVDVNAGDFEITFN